MNSFLSLTNPFTPWFRGLSRLTQWVTGLPIVAACTWLSIVAMRPTATQQGFWVTLLVTVALIVLSELLRPKPDIENARPAGLGDFQVPTTTEDRHIGLIWGTVRQKGPNVIFYGDLLQQAITEKVKTGLWSSERITTGFRYHLGIQMGLCRGPNVVLKRVWIGDDEVFNGTVSTDTFFDIDKPKLFGGEKLGAGGVRATCDFYTGSITQPVNAYLNVDSRQRVATAITPTAPRYSGTCHVVARQFTSAAPLASNRGASLGTSTSVKPWSFELQRFTGIFTGQSAGEDKVGVDANPVNVIYEILTDKEWGFGFADSDIDLTNFKAVSDIMISEVNGFSLLLDREMLAQKLIDELQRQMDGVVFLSQTTGKWTIKLARADYDIDLVEQLTDDNVAEVKDYSRGSWADTTNTISVGYIKREDNYKASFAFAQDMANAMIQGSGTIATAAVVSGRINYPGCKNSPLASFFAWRALRAQSFPLARCVLVVNQQMWQLAIGDVVAWTNTKLGFVKLPMRIIKIDYGRLTSNKMTLTVVQDVFQFAAASMGTPEATGWTPPAAALAAFPAAELKVFEAPRAIVVRDTKFAGDDTVTKILCSARAQEVGEVTFLVNERHASGTPSGPFSEAGEVFQFMKIGQLDAALVAGVANPTASILVNATPDSQVDLEEAFDDTTSDVDLGQNLSHIIMVGTEFMLVRDAAISGADVNLQGVFRGVLDSAQTNHAQDADVFLLFLGAGITDTNFVNTHNVDIELRMQSSTAVFGGAVTPVALTMAKRAIRPYPPAAVLYNGGSTEFGVPDVEGDGGAGENTFGFDVDWFRRAFDNTDELVALQSDNTGVDASTEFRVRVFVDPDGINTEILSGPTAWSTGQGLSGIIPRLEIQELAAAGTEIRVQIESRHDIGAEVDLVSRHNFIHDVVPTSVNDGLFYLGGNLRAADLSNVYTTVDSGVFTVRIGAAYTTSNVEASINGGGFTTIIAATGTSGTTASLTAGDTITLRHSVNETPNPQFVEIENPSAVRVAYGMFSD